MTKIDMITTSIAVILLGITLIFCIVNTAYSYANHKAINVLNNEYETKVCGQVWVMPKQDGKAGGYCND